MAIKALFPAIRPSLNLDFTKGFVDPRITFTRASSATRFNSKGLLEVIPSGVPRLDYDPVTRSPKGLLIEEQRTNLLTYSEQFDNGAWSKSRSTILADSVTSPDGVASADKLVESIEYGSHYVYRNYSAVSGTAYTFSFFAKVAGRNLVYANSSASSNTTCNFDLATAGITAEGLLSKASIVPVGNGWCRVSISFTATITGSAIALIGILPSSGYQGDGTSGIYLWGAQLEVGAFPTSYIPTTTAAVTRAADRAEMLNTNFSSWYRQDEGTFFVKYTLGQKLASIRTIAVTDGTSNNYIEAIAAAGTVPAVNSGSYLLSVVNGVTVASTSSGSILNVANATRLFAGSYKLNDYASCNDGKAVGVDTDASVPIVDRLLFSNNAGEEQINGHIRRIAYYPARIPNDQLQALTT